MRLDGLDVELRGIAASHHDLADELGALGADIDATSAQLDALEARLARLTGDAAPQPQQRLMAAARIQLRTRHCRLDDGTLEDLLDPAEVARIHRRMTGRVDLSARLDAPDVVAAVAAGVVAAAVDIALTAAPATSPITTWLRSHAGPSDNWLSRLATVPYDAVVDTGIAGMSPLTHRVQTLGHDPLVGLVYGTRDILAGTLTGVSPDGVLHIVARGMPTADSWPAALGIQILHLLSDIPTSTGLPLPGLGGLCLLPGPGDADTLAHLGRQLYLGGYDTWHLPALAAPAGAIELVCRTYWGLRRTRDADFAAATGAPADDPRYAALTAVATGVAAAADLAHVLATGNLTAANYVTWLAAAKAGRDHVRSRITRPVDQLEATLDHQLDTLRFTWPV